ncbi:MAG TPA: hypothetical protein VEB18_01460 [Candidatus Paceibacterota bacterium]|nr:hypothetical protein [Candidatus Paceibacterota bacterium]
MSKVLEAIRRNRRLYNGRVRKKIQALKKAFHEEINLLEEGVIESANNRSYRYGMDHRVCKQIHSALLALHNHAEEHHVRSLIKEWVDARGWGAEVMVSVTLCHGLVYFSWR